MLHNSIDTCLSLYTRHSGLVVGDEAIDNVEGINCRLHKRESLRRSSEHEVLAEVSVTEPPKAWDTPTRHHLASASKGNTG